MSFNRASFEYLGGGAVGSNWRYVTADNLSTGYTGNVHDSKIAKLNGKDSGGNYFADAFTYFGVRAWDYIDVISNSASSVPMLSIWTVTAADANGVSLICAFGQEN